MKRIPPKCRLYAVLAVIALLAGAWFGLKSHYAGQPNVWQPRAEKINWVSTQHFDDNKITVNVGVRNPHGNRIGDIQGFHVEVIADAKTQIDLSSLIGGALTVQNLQSSDSYDDLGGYGSQTTNPPVDFELAAPAVITDHWSHGKHVYEIDIQARAFKVAPQLNFYVDMQYADDVANGTPMWMPLEVAAVQVETTVTAQEHDQFDTGDATAKAGPMAPFAMPLFALGGIGMLWLLVGVLRRKKAPAAVAAEAEAKRAWRIIDAAFSKADRTGWTEASYMAIDGALRRYLNLPTQSVSEIAAIADLPNKTVVARVFRSLENSLYSGKRLTSTERSQLRSQLQRIIPRD